MPMHSTSMPDAAYVGKWLTEEAALIYKITVWHTCVNGSSRLKKCFPYCVCLDVWHKSRCTNAFDLINNMKEWFLLMVYDINQDSIIETAVFDTKADQEAVCCRLDPLTKITTRYDTLQCLRRFLCLVLWASFLN